jgi:hypothetical protein
MQDGRERGKEESDHGIGVLLQMEGDFFLLAQPVDSCKHQLQRDCISRRWYGVGGGESTCFLGEMGCGRGKNLWAGGLRGSRLNV